VVILREALYFKAADSSNNGVNCGMHGNKKRERSTTEFTEHTERRKAKERNTHNETH
jgi:hypothetical protein